MSKATLLGLVVSLLVVTAGCAPKVATVAPGCGAIAGTPQRIAPPLGALYRLPLDPLTAMQSLATAAASDCGPPFILADAPEQVGQNGITAEAPINGTAVFFYYQRTGSATPMYFLPTVINTGRRPITVTVGRQGVQVGATAPTTDLRMEAAYLGQTMHQVMTVAPHHWIWLDPAVSRQPVPYDALGVGQFLLATSGPAMVAMVATADPASADPMTMAVLPLPTPLHSAGRGLFPHADRMIAFLATHFPVVFPLDRNSLSLDPYIRGTDPSTGAPALDVGNYGILYHVHITLRGTPGTVLGVFLSPAGSSQSQAADTLAEVAQFPWGSTLLLPGDGIPVRADDSGVLVAMAALNAQGQGHADFRILPPSGLDAQMHLTVLPLAQAQRLFSPQS